MTELLLVHWVTPAQHRALLDGRSVATADPEPERLARLCAENAVPWAPQSSALSCFVGAVPLRVAAAHRGSVRLELDVSWLLGDLRLASDRALAPWLLALAERADRGASIDAGLRAVTVLGGAPSDREDHLRALCQRAGPAGIVEARILRALDLDDVDTAYVETGLAILEA